MQQKLIKQKYLIFLLRSIKDWKFWVKLLIGATQIISIIIFIIFSTVVEGDMYAVAKHLSFFTTLSNLFCAVFFLFSAVFHHNEGKGDFDNTEIAKIVITYITLTILIYNLDQISAKDAYLFSSWKYTMSFICEHSLVPILAVNYYLFFYNHVSAKSFKVFSQKWVWYMISGLIIYLTFFSVIGLIGRFFEWKALFGTMDGSGQYSTFVYPFMDWYHGVGFFKHLPSWLECIIMLIGTVLVSVIVDYVYTFFIIQFNKYNQQRKSLHKNETEQILKDIYLSEK